MHSKKQLENTIELTQNLKNLAQAYEQISVTRMQRVRGRVFAARDYLDELADVFADVKSSYQSEIQALLKGKKDTEGNITYVTRHKNGKSIAVLLSSNSKLHGDIGRKVFNYFVQRVNKGVNNIFVIGKVGKEMYDQSGMEYKYRYVDLPEGEGARETLGEILKVLSEHESVTVFYGRFVNFLSQNPTETNVSGIRKDEENKPPQEKKKFFFEPSLESILELFENQIFSALFRQTLHESELSHVGARIRQMEDALQNIKLSEGKLYSARRSMIKREEGQKQLQRISGRNLWK